MRYQLEPLTGLKDPGLVALAVGGSTGRLYAFQSIGASVTMFARGQISLRRQDLCVARGRGLVVAARSVTVIDPSRTGLALIVDTNSGAVLRSIKTPSEIADVIAIS
jgi:hypothetical protein